MLFEQVERLRERGVAIVYISHRLEELARISQRIAVLRDGRLVCVRMLSSGNASLDMGRLHRTAQGAVTNSTGVSTTPSFSCSGVCPASSLSAVWIPNTACFAANWSAVASTRPSLSIGLIAWILS